MKDKILILILIIIPLFTGCDKSELLSIHIIDVGQGDSILIKTPQNKNILVDGGTEDSQYIIKSYLKKQGIKSLDTIISTHPDSDHIGSLDYIIQNFDVDKIYMPKVSTNTTSYKNLTSACNKKKLKLEYLFKDDFLDIEDNITLQVLSPSYIQDENNLNSIVFNLNFKNKSFLFTGDCESPNEKDIIDSYELDDIDFVKIGHHGSNSSTSMDFLNEITPDIAAISCGYKNQYGHPHKQTIENLNSMNVLTYRTDLLGDIVFYSDGNVIFTKKKYNINNI